MAKKLLNKSHKHYFYPSMKITAILTWFIFIFLFAQPATTYANNCAVSASFTPATRDSVFTTDRPVSFQSTSTNVTSLKWVINGLTLSTSPSFNYYFIDAGVYEFKLIASNGTCSDTSIAVYVLTGQQPANRDKIQAYQGLSGFTNTPTSITSATGGGYLAGGYVADIPVGNYTFYESGLVIKIAEGGCAEWSRTLRNQFYTKVEKTLALKDGGFLVTGLTDNKLFLLNLSSTGDVRWSRTLNVDGEQMTLTSLLETDDGHFVIGGQVWNKGIVVIKSDTNGNVQWTRFFEKPGGSLTGYVATKLLHKDNDVYLFCDVALFQPGPVTGTITPFGNLLKLNYTTGQTRWTKTMLVNNEYVNPRDLQWYKDGLVLNCFATTGITNANNTIIHVDTAGNPRWAKTVATTSIPLVTANSVLLPLPGGSWYLANHGIQLLNLQPYSFAHSIFVKFDADFNPVWTKHYMRYANAPLAYAAAGAKDALVGLGKESGPGNNYFTDHSLKFAFVKMDSAAVNPSDPYCRVTETPVTIHDAVARNVPFAWTTEGSAVSTFSPQPLTVTAAYPHTYFHCPTDFIDSCSFIRLYGPTDICRLNETVEFKVKRNNGCAIPLKWILPPTGCQIIKQTDSSLQVRFTSFQKLTVRALLEFSCNPVIDSLVVDVRPKGNLTLNLGADTSLCDGNTRILKAGKGFLNYLWSDGTTADSLTASQPGTYWVQVNDSCNNILTDTIRIAQAPPVPLSLGPDRVKCNNDTLHINAPAGFITYSWGPAPAISNPGAAQIIVNPTADISYFLKAEKTPGCFGFDTIRVKVNNSPPVQLGADLSFCKTDSAIVSAGYGFAGFAWSTGVTTQQAVLKTSGTYWVIATAANGCTSSDTIQVLQVFDTPVVKLNQDTAICTGDSKLLDAGSFDTYLWNTGATTRTISIFNPGTYSVTVTDANGCRGTGVSKLSGLRPLPVPYLGTDTAVCSYGTLDLNTASNYTSYLWNTGAATKQINISQPGTYWLQVQDQYGCKGSDSITVTRKECLTGFYMPNAFTPDGNGLNDVIKPFLFGRVAAYEFSIYNRFGERIFVTTNLTQGWNGQVNNQPQPPGVFAWRCTWQMVGEKPEQRSGTLQLIR
ncbi:T9SS type B sorting domain-containing protein [Lacibacter luteus]|uniref:T9SS type B sorting domain-containing protein n=1 Tax=Lacibacter luteus TaxID=2508719 RepID=A0A4V1M7N1_9BACT|nr:gliding motility-associated C-terminal domain-containing protein [Lacibacter luteus]RXK60655.1 T9SS type B sorting domain-containing protein [Lacibacter luteus]